MRLQKYRGKWAVVWSENGVTKRSSLRTADRDEAERRFKDRGRLLARQHQSGELTVADIVLAYADDLEERGKSGERVRYAMKRLREKFGVLRPDQVTKKLCREYIAERRDHGVSDGTIRTELGRLRSALVAHDKRTAAEIELPPDPGARERWITREEYARLRDATRSDHMRLFVVLALATAARKGAILQLTWDRVDFETGRINLGKRVGNKGRGVKPMTPEARRELEKAYAGRTCGYVIEYAGKPLGSIDAAFARAVKRAGIPKIGPHDIRRSAGRWMAEDGVPMAEIAAYLDHKDMKVTIKHYAVFSPDFLAGAARSLEVE